MNIALYFYTLITLALIDAVWLFSTGAKYKEWLGHLFASTPNFIPAIIFYLLYTFGLVYFVINPALKNGASLAQVCITGALFGLIAYATYDLTNHATMKDWPYFVTIIDMVWGMILTGITSVIVVYISKHLN